MKSVATLRDHVQVVVDVPRPILAVGREVSVSLISTSASLSQRAPGPIQVVDLFCGAGGFSAGFAAFSEVVPVYRITAAADIDETSCETYAANLGVAPKVADLADAASSSRKRRALIESLGVDASAPLVLCGGPPCQGFSSHRKKDGDLQDHRDGLVPAFGALACDLKPDVVIFENVPEVASAKNWRLLSEMAAKLRRAGYQLSFGIHNLAGFGVPQERFRALLLAARTRIRSPEPYLRQGQYVTVRQAIGSLPRIRPGTPHSSDPMHHCTGHRQSTIDTIKKIPKDGGRRPPGVGPACLQGVDGFRDVYGRLFWDKPSNTITAFARNPASGRYVHPQQDRGLSVREAALLQGFPRNYEFKGSFDHRFLQIGNAVPPTFSAYLAAHILEHLIAGSHANHEPSDEFDSWVPSTKSFSSSIAGRKGRAA